MKIKFRKRKNPELVVDSELQKNLDEFDSKYPKVEGETVENKIQRMTSFYAIRDLEIEMHKKYG